MKKISRIVGGILLLLIVGIGCGSSSKKLNENTLKLHTVSFNGDESVDIEPVILDKSIQEDGNLQLQSILQQLADELSQKKFYGLEIDVIEIQSIDGREVASINLVEKHNKSLDEVMSMYSDSNGEYISWYKFAQGSTGSQCTLKSIKETLLQKYYVGKWIDGLKLLYNGAEDIVLGHIELDGEIQWRSEINNNNIDYLAVPSLREVKLTDSNIASIPDLSPDEIMINDICQKYLNACINNEVNILELYRATPIDEFEPTSLKNIDTIILRWDPTDIDAEEAYVNAEIHSNDIDWYYYFEMFLVKNMEDWKISYTQVQP